jgi:hypothetical protein
MSNIKIRFTVLKSSLITSSVILVFLTTLSYFSRSLYDSVKVSIPYEYIFLALLVLIVTTIMYILVSLSYIIISEPFRSVEETFDSLELLSYYLDRLFRFTNPKEYAKAVELGLR